MIQKRSCSLSTKVNLNFYEMIKIHLIINKMWIFLQYMNLYSGHKHFTDNFPKQD